MNSIKQIRELNKRELEAGVTTEGSWHVDYRDTAYVYIGGLPFDYSEGDIITVFSQYGEPVWVNLVRDKDTGKSKGFCFLRYEDQRSCDLAVDNLGGAEVMGRMLRVDHTRYRPRDGEDMRDNTGGDIAVKEPESEESETERRPLLKEEIELQELMREHDDDDPMKAYMIEQKKEEVQEALKRLPKEKKRRSGKDKTRDKERKHRGHRSHRHRSRSRSNDGDRGSDKEMDRHRRRRHRSRSYDKDGTKSRHRRSRSIDDTKDSTRRRRHRGSMSPARRYSRSPRRERSPR